MIPLKSNIWIKFQALSCPFLLHPAFVSLWSYFSYIVFHNSLIWYFVLIRNTLNCWKSHEVYKHNCTKIVIQNTWYRNLATQRVRDTAIQCLVQYIMLKLALLFKQKLIKNWNWNSLITLASLMSCRSRLLNKRQQTQLCINLIKNTLLLKILKYILLVFWLKFISGCQVLNP